MRILITGAAGFIGSHAWKALEQGGHELVGIDSLDPQVHGELARDVNPKVWVDTINHAPITIEGVNLFDVDVVIHLAAAVGVGQSQYEPARYVEANVMETARLWERIIDRKARIRKVICASSMSIYGEGEYMEQCHDGQDRSILNARIERAVSRGWDAFDIVWPDSKRTPTDNLKPKPTREHKPAEPASVYAQSKYDTEIYSRILGKTYGIPTVALRFFNVFGPGQALANPYTGVLSQFACRVLNEKPPLVYEDGGQSRDFIHVRDIVGAIVAAVEREDLDGVFNVATGRATSVLHLATQWCRIAQSRGLRHLDPEVLNTYRAGDVRHCIGSPAALKAATGWEAQVGLEDGLVAYADWIIANGLHQTPPTDASARAREELQNRGLESA